MDFDDLLLNVNILFRDFPDALEKYQNQFGYILVDEYQDTNFAQYAIIRRLAQNHANVCVVGDDAQSIYSFRGAKIENILRFQNDFPDAKVPKLEQNYRSTQNIVNAANSIIEKNTKQIRKKSFSSGDQGEKIKVTKAYTDKEEASLIASDLYAAVRGGGVPTARRPCCIAPTRSRGRWRRRCATGTYPTRYTASCRSISARRSRTCSPTCGWSSTRRTTRRSAASSTRPRAGSAT